MRLTLTGRTLGAALAVFVLAVGGGVAYATIPSSAGIYDACLDGAGKLRLIDAEAGQTCKEKETPISWSQGARLACSDGMILSTGVCIEETSRPAGQHFEAEDDCADEGMRLPSGGELTTFAEVDGITLASGGEWTDDVADVTRGSSFDYFVVADPGNGVEQATEDVAYRCVTGPGLR